MPPATRPLVGVGPVPRGQNLDPDAPADWNRVAVRGEISRVELTRAAGGILWRRTCAGLRIAVVHRPRRGDWSLPKGRLQPGETFRRAALREVSEETGCSVRLRSFAGAKLFVDRPQPKLVVYWHMEFAGGESQLPADEVDEVAWLSRRAALSRLDHASDRALLARALAEAPLGGIRSAPAAAHLHIRQRLIVDAEDAEDDIPMYIGMIARAVSAPLRRTQGAAAEGR